MADNNLTNNDLDTDVTRHETEPATKHDVGIGGGLGAVGGAVVGALAGGPIGAVIGAVVGGAASAGAVDVVDKHDHDYARTADGANAAGADSVYPAGNTTGYAATATDYTGPGDYQRTQTAAPIADNYATTAQDHTAVGTDNERKVELYKEELNASTQAVQTGEVTLRKEVITENRTIDVPVTREEVVIERHAVSGDRALAGNVNFDDRGEEVIRVPVMEEQVTVTKTPVVTEEISLGKRQVTETQHVSDTVRHEEAYIDNPSNVDVLQRGDSTHDS